MDRDDFVNQLIEELQKQNSSIDFYSKSKGCHDIFRTLCYDYPIVASHGMILLNNHLLTNLTH
jgi:hypothetical protein